VFFHVSLGRFLLILLAFVVLDLVFSVLSQEIGWEEHLQNYLFCVEWDIKTLISQSVWLGSDKGTIHYCRLSPLKSDRFVCFYVQFITAITELVCRVHSPLLM